MSYEGYTEFLCKNGHYYCVDIHAPAGEVCPICGEKAAYSSEVDLTNGENENDPYSMPAPRKLIGYSDEWRLDHYGNRYAIKHGLYAPKMGSKRWKSIS